jgi:membrane protease YdiL (CAAX protease family)
VGIFFAICLLHRLVTRPAAPVGVAGLDVGVSKFFSIFLACILIGVALSALSHFLLVKIFKLEESGNGQTLRLFVMQLIIVGLAIAAARRWKIFSRDRSRHTNYHLEVIGSAIYNSGVLIPMVYICVVIWKQCLDMLGVAVQTQEVVKILQGATGNYRILFLVQAVIFTPIFEEIFFRGFIYKSLKSITVGSIANLLTALLFAVLHGNILSFVPLFAMSVGLVNVYERNGDIREPMLIHSFFNAANAIFIIGEAASHGTIG